MSETPAAAAVEIKELRPRGFCITSQSTTFIPRNAVVYLAEDLDWDEELVSEVVAAMKDFTGHQRRIKAGYSHMAGSPVLGFA